MIKIENISKPYYNKAREFIIQAIKDNIETDEKTFLNIIADLDDMEKNYLQNNNKFWIAINDVTDEIVGTIALIEISQKIGLLKRFYTNKEMKIGALLYDVLEKYVKENGFSKMYLVSGKELKSAHKFYKENGWKKTDIKDENINVYIRSNSDLYTKEISENVKTDTIAEILINAIPYIKKYSQSIIVIKYGGNAMIGSKTVENVMKDIVLLQSIGVKVVLVHGGGPEITKVSEKMNIDTEFVNGLRITNKEMLEVCEMVLCGKTNKKLVKALQKCGGKAVGISGIDGNMVYAKQKDEKLGFVGDIEEIDIGVITDLLESGYITVISSIGTNRNGETYNINSDTLVSSIAGELKAERLFILTNVKGIYKDFSNKDSLIEIIKINEVEELISNKYIIGGMIPKAECAVNAIKMGVEKVTIIDGTEPHSVIKEMFTVKGYGTIFEK